MPSYKVKRGLLNPLGSIIKLITGNLDNDDAIKYNKLIEKVKTQQYNINQKITLTSEIVKGLINVTQVIDSNLSKLNENIKNLDVKIESKTARDHFNYVENCIVNTYNLLLHNFQNIFSKLNEIETAVAFSRVGILHQSIIESDKLIVLLKQIERSHKLLYSVLPENLVRIEETIIIKSYYSESKITFILEIPLIKPDTYSYYKLIPIPVIIKNHTLIIIPKYPYLIAKGLRIKSFAQPCQEIEKSRFLCTEENGSRLVEDACITDLMRYANNINSCKQIPIKIEDFKIEPLQQNRWIIYTKSDAVLSKVCDNEIFRQTLRGTYILTLNDLCNVQVHNVTLQIHNTTVEKVIYEKLPIIKLPRITPSIPMGIKHLNLEGVDLKNIRFLAHNLQNSEINSESGNNGLLTVKSVSVWTLILYVILTISLIIIIYKHKNILLKFFYRNSPNHSSSVNFDPNGGGVMQTDSILS